MKVTGCVLDGDVARLLRLGCGLFVEVVQGKVQREAEAWD